MAKFVIQCPSCGRYAEAKTGFFAKKHVECSCGNIINVKTDKLSSRICGHCGNHVVFDQSKGAQAKCPICGEPINTLAEQEKNVEFSCAQCGIRLSTAKGAATYTCPVCDHVNDVAERLVTERIKHDGLASVIKYEGDAETIVWKHPIEDFNLGSQLLVHESQEAIFFRDGQALDLFPSGRHTLETQQMPVLEKLYKLPTDTEGTFHSEVYFINTATIMGVKWGTDSKVRLFDPASGMHVELGARGEFNIKVINSRKLLLKLVGTTGGLHQGQLLGGSNSKGFFRSMVMAQVKSYLAAAIRENSIGVLEIDERIMELGEALRDKINPRLAEYGLELSEFFISEVVTPDDANFRRMKEQYAEQYLGVRDQQIRRNIAAEEGKAMAVEAQNKAQVKIIGAQGDAEALRITKAAEAEAYRMQAAAEAEEMRMKGYTYQQETARQVGLEAMQNGISGGGMAGGMGELAGLGMTLGAMGSVMNMTRDALSPVMQESAQMGKAIGGSISGGWDCSCGNKGITGRFCGECGAKKPEPAATWDCPVCGTKGITGKFCGECGAKKPEPAATWDCACGNKGITGKFCGECGAKKPETPETWDCTCGNKGITGKFCPECGNKKG